MFLVKYCLILLLVCAANINTKITKKSSVELDEKHYHKWSGKWFPNEPDQMRIFASEAHHKKTSTKKKDYCDDGVHGLVTDYDPNDKRHNYNYLCITSNRSAYEPSYKREAVLKIEFVPPAYVPNMRCINESIHYDEELPTFGTFRPLAPKYGEYKYLPPQRWLHSLAEGAIVMLYHPCANSKHVSEMKQTLQSCLYRHIITPTQYLSPERPLALLAYGKSLKMSVPVERFMVDFIRKNAKDGPLVRLNLVKENHRKYEADLKTEAHLVTDVGDSQLCAYHE